MGIEELLEVDIRILIRLRKIERSKASVGFYEGWIKERDMISESRVSSERV